MKKREWLKFKLKSQVKSSALIKNTFEKAEGKADSEISRERRH